MSESNDGYCTTSGIRLPDKAVGLDGLTGVHHYRRIGGAGAHPLFHEKQTNVNTYSNLVKKLVRTLGQFVRRDHLRDRSLHCRDGSLVVERRQFCKNPNRPERSTGCYHRVGRHQHGEYGKQRTTRPCYRSSNDARHSRRPYLRHFHQCHPL